MGTQHCMARVRHRPGHIMLTVLLGTLPACLRLWPSAVFARSNGQAGARSLSSARISPTGAVRNKVQGIDAFDAALYTQAHAYLNKAYKLNPQFAAAHAFDVQVIKRELEGSPQAQLQPLLTWLFVQQSWIDVIGGGLILFLVSVLVLRTQPEARPAQQPVTEAFSTGNYCPRCGEPVRAETIDCLSCHYHLVPAGKAVTVQARGALAPVTEKRTIFQCMQTAPVRETGAVSESEYAAVEAKLRILWNRVG